MKESALGIVLATKEKGGVLAIDFDDVNYEEMVEEIRTIQSKFRLGGVLVVKSSKDKLNYHALFFWNHLIWEQIIEVLEFCTLVDPEFVKFKKETGKLRIRGSAESETIEIIGSQFAGKLQQALYTGWKSMVDAIRFT